MGKRLGGKDPKSGDLGGYVVKIAAVKRPVVVLLENVETFFEPKRHWYRDLDDAFKQAGYVCCYEILLAWDFGLPQHRRRGFMVAVREDVNGAPFKFPPAPMGKPVTIRESLLAPDSADLSNYEKLRQEDVHIEWRKRIWPGRSWKEIMDEIPEDWRTHTGLMHLGAIKALNIGAGGELFHDLGHHSCLTGSNTRPWILTQGTDDEGPVARKLHPRERCRIQGFPDGFELKCTTEVLRIKQLGNSVPPPMVEWIGRAVAEQYRAAFVDNGDDNENGNDQDSNNDKGTTTPKAEKSSRKSRRKPHKSKHHSHRHSKRHSKRRSRHSSGSKERRKSRDSRKSSRKSSRKRQLSSDLDMSPPPKRQHRERAPSPDGEAEFAVRTAGFDGDVEKLVRE